MSTTATELRLGPDPAHVGRARRFAVGAAAALGADAEAQEVVRSLVSELVTNVVLHAGTDVLVRVRDGEDAVVVEVVDGSPVAAVQRRVTGTSTTGRGLRLLRALSAHTEVRPAGDVLPGGKLVLFTVCKTSTDTVRQAMASASEELFAADVREVLGGAARD